MAMATFTCAACGVVAHDQPPRPRLDGWPPPRVSQDPPEGWRLASATPDGRRELFCPDCVAPRRQYEEAVREAWERVDADPQASAARAARRAADKAEDAARAEACARAPSIPVPQVSRTVRLTIDELRLLIEAAYNEGHLLGQEGMPCAGTRGWLDEHAEQLAGIRARVGL